MLRGLLSLWEGEVCREMFKDVVLGPLNDLRRLFTSMLAKPPSTRVVSGAGLAAARRALTEAGCDLLRCTVENLHTFPVHMEASQLFDLLVAWQHWPCSSFFPCVSSDEQGSTWLAYRWWKAIPVVMMKLRVAEGPSIIIYDIVWGIGSGGYHAFLVDQAERLPAHSACSLRTNLSIFTTLPLPWLFPEGFHDRVNYDIYRKLVATCS
jgi:hypothetical protein